MDNHGRDPFERQTIASIDRGGQRSDEVEYAMHANGRGSGEADMWVYNRIRKTSSRNGVLWLHILMREREMTEASNRKLEGTHRVRTHAVLDIFIHHGSSKDNTIK